MARFRTSCKLFARYIHMWVLSFKKCMLLPISCILFIDLDVLWQNEIWLVNLRTAWKFECDWHWNEWLPSFLNWNKQGPVALAFLLVALSVSLCGKVKKIFGLKGGWLKFSTAQDNLFQMSNQLKKNLFGRQNSARKNYTIQIFFYRGRASVPFMRADATLFYSFRRFCPAQSCFLFLCH